MMRDLRRFNRSLGEISNSERSNGKEVSEPEKKQEKKKEAKEDQEEQAEGKGKRAAPRKKLGV
jgi:hypothetical protein